MSNSKKSKLKKNSTTDAKAPDASSKKLTAKQEEQLRSQALLSKLLSASFAEIISVLMKSPAHRKLTLADLDWLVVPAIRSGQYQLAGSQQKGGAPSAPLGLALWANVSKDVDKRLSKNLDQPIHLDPKEWNSGDIIWIIELVGEKKAISAIFQHLLKTTFKGKAIKSRVLDDDGKRFVKVFNDKS